MPQWTLPVDGTPDGAAGPTVPVRLGREAKGVVKEVRTPVLMGVTVVAITRDVEKDVRVDSVGKGARDVVKVDSPAVGNRESEKVEIEVSGSWGVDSTGGRRDMMDRDVDMVRVGTEIVGIERVGIVIVGNDKVGTETVGIEMVETETETETDKLAATVPLRDGRESVGIERVGMETDGIETVGMEIVGIEMLGIEIVGIETVGTDTETDKLATTVPLRGGRETVDTRTPPVESEGNTDEFSRPVGRTTGMLLMLRDGSAGTETETDGTGGRVGNTKMVLLAAVAEMPAEMPTETPAETPAEMLRVGAVGTASPPVVRLNTVGISGRLPFSRLGPARPPVVRLTRGGSVGRVTFRPVRVRDGAVTLRLADRGSST